MKKFFALVFLFLLFVVFTFSGCVIPETPTETPPNEPVDDTISVDVSSLGFTFSDVVKKCKAWGVSDDEEEIKEFLCGLNTENVYVNAFGSIKVVADATYNLINERDEYQLDAASATGLKDILSFSISDYGSLTLNYYDGTQIFCGNLWELGEDKYQIRSVVIKSVIINKSNQVVLSYEDKSILPVGKLKTDTVDEDDSRLVFKKMGESYLIVDVFSTKVKNVEIPSTFMGNPVVGISGLAFSRTSELEEIIIPKTIRKIHVNAFADCEKLKIVNYRGSLEEWSDIIIMSGNQNLTSATINYNYS